MNDQMMLILGTLGITAIVIGILFVINDHIKPRIKELSKAEDDSVMNIFAKIASSSSVAFEEALKNAFNEAIADGVITKEEAMNIITLTFSAVKDNIIKTSSELIKNRNTVDDSDPP